MAEVKGKEDSSMRVSPKTLYDVDKIDGNDWMAAGTRPIFQSFKSVAVKSACPNCLSETQGEAAITQQFHRMASWEL